eukprot:GHVU01183474.1.p3 GENE.GHVU01183474.1~~GHVU01183474.1.p3  ORF type:complete len:129 (+),score=0.08 GHVU01183474.1:25-411(+)
MCCVNRLVTMQLVYRSGFCEGGKMRHRAHSTVGGPGKLKLTRRSPYLPRYSNLNPFSCARRKRSRRAVHAFVYEETVTGHPHEPAGDAHTQRHDRRDIHTHMQHVRIHARRAGPALTHGRHTRHRRVW